MILPKPKTFRSESYLAFVREHHCEICLKPSNERPKPDNNILAHHESLGKNMQGGKPPDSHAVPLCWYCHGYRHGLSWKGWDNEYINIERVVIRLLTEYLQERNNETKR